MELIVAFVSFFAVTGAWLVLPSKAKPETVRAVLPNGVPSAA